jgi:hypothetical protein
MCRLLKLFPIDAAEADRAAAEIRSLFHWPDFLAAIAYAAFLVIGLPAALLFFGVIGGVL